MKTPPLLTADGLSVKVLQATPNGASTSLSASMVVFDP